MPLLYGLLLVLLLGLIVVAFSGTKHVAWADKMRRMSDLLGNRAEWTAPDYVRQQVRADYLDAFYQLTHAPMLTREAAERYLSGTMLLFFREVMLYYRTDPRFFETLCADHYVMVRSFSEDGERCLLFDRQTNRKVTLLRDKDLKPWFTQAIDDAVYVYRMVYDRSLRRWKIESFLYQIPLSVGNDKHLFLYPSTVLSPNMPKMGREN